MCSDKAEGLVSKVAERERDRIQGVDGLGGAYNPQAAAMATDSIRPAGVTISWGAGQRRTARQQLLEMAGRMRVKADQITRLAMALPIELHPEADAALDDIIAGRTR